MRHAIAILILAISLPVGAAEYRSPGDMPCPQAIDAPDGMTWVDAYMTAIRHAAKGTDVYGLTLDAAVHWVVSWCRANPDATLQDAVTTLTRDRMQADKRPLLNDDQFFGRRPL